MYWFSVIFGLSLIISVKLEKVVRYSETDLQPEDDHGRMKERRSRFCNTDFYDSYGVITSPNYPGKYGTWENCTYRIHLSKYRDGKTRTVEFKFDRYEVESCEPCCDYITITNSIFPGKKLCHSDDVILERYYYAPTDQWTLDFVFRSDGFTNFRGFRLEYGVLEYNHTNECSGSCDSYCGYMMWSRDFAGCCVCMNVTHNETNTPAYTTTLSQISKCPVVHCPNCSVGYHHIYNYSGLCPVCVCEISVTTTVLPSKCPPLTCPNCSAGFDLKFEYFHDKNGCTTCHCVPSTSTTTLTSRCPPLKCVTCARGYALHYDYSGLNNGGCTRCYCVPNTAATTTSSSDTSITTFYGTHGVIRSPVHADTIPVMNYTYRIYVKDYGYPVTLELKFSAFALDDWPNCKHDYLEISYPDFHGKRVCNKNQITLGKPYNVILNFSVADHVDINFQSNSGFMDKRFKIEYSVQQGRIGNVCDNGLCGNCSTGTRDLYDIIGCKICHCSSAHGNTTYAVTGETTPSYPIRPGSISKSTLLQMLMQLSNEAKTLETFAHNVQQQAELTYNIVKNNFYDTVKRRDALGMVPDN